MADTDDRAAAKIALKAVIQDTVDPVVTDPELEALLDEAKVATTWVLNTVYAYNAVVMPTTRNGHRYRAVQSGTSGATQPTWPTGEGETVTDNTVIWEEAGSQYSTIYDLRSLKRAGCLLKSRKASNRFAFSADGGSFHPEQTPEYWREEAKRYAAVGVA